MIGKLEKINVKRASNDYTTSHIYQNIEAKVIFSEQRFSHREVENSEMVDAYVMVWTQYNLIRTGDIIEYTDSVGISRKLKVIGLGEVPFISKESFIDIKTKLV